VKDAEVISLLKRFARLINRSTWEVWAAAGRPPGIQPEDLRNAGCRAVLEAFDDDSPLPFLARVKLRVESRLWNELRNLQVGAVTTNKVMLASGRYGRFHYSLTADVGELIESNLLSPRTNGALPRLTPLAQHHSRGNDPVGDGVAARLDFASAVSSIPDPLDLFLLWTFHAVQMPPFGGQPDVAMALNKAWRTAEQAFGSRRAALGVTVWLCSVFLPPREIRARLERAARWVQAYCDGHPLAKYPNLPRGMTRGFVEATSEDANSAIAS
jgi:hypothetical protein